MSYPSQKSTLARLEKETNSALDALIDKGWGEVSKWWNLAKERMKMVIAHEYRNAHRGGTWTLPTAKMAGTLARIDHEVTRILTEFHEQSVFEMQLNFGRIYRHSAFRHAWMLDQVTPDSYETRIPTKVHLLNESMRIMTPSEYATDWKERWATWLGAYRGALANNLKLGAINESTVDDAVDEIDATKAGTPSSFLDDVLQRLYMTQAVLASSGGAMDVFDENDDMIEEEIWQTRYKLDVCDDCSDNLGLTMEEADGEIPMHPNCRCYWRVVPKAWADLLRSGSADDRDLAKQLDAMQAVPDSMRVRNDDGDIVGKVVVSFQRWLEGSGMAVKAQ